jgi:hypothetical protein
MPAPQRNASPSFDINKLTAVDLESIVSLQRASEISTLSEDTWRREHPEKIIKLSPRRSGVRLKHALMLSD